MSETKSSHKWLVVTDLETVTVWGDSVAQARNRAKWKAAHTKFLFRNRAEELTAVRECKVLEIKQLF